MLDLGYGKDEDSDGEDDYEYEQDRDEEEAGGDGFEEMADGNECHDPSDDQTIRLDNDERGAVIKKSNSGNRINPEALSK